MNLRSMSSLRRAHRARQSRRAPTYYGSTAICLVEAWQARGCSKASRRYHSFRVCASPAVSFNADVSSIPDNSTKKIAQNNILTSSTRTNPYLSHRLFHDIPATSANDKLFDFQSRTSQSNAYTLDLEAFKYSGVAKST